MPERGWGRGTGAANRADILSSYFQARSVSATLPRPRLPLHRRRRRGRRRRRRERVLVLGPHSDTLSDIYIH